jgi:quinoprotein glucose dehydrogenase
MNHSFNARKRRRLLFTYRTFLYALDRLTGKPIPGFGDNGRIDLRFGLDRPPESVSISASSPGVIFEDMIIMPSTVPETLPGSPGDIRAFDVNTGKQRWIFHTIPHPGEFGYETWSPDSYKISGGANAWAGLSIDPKLGIVFAATGSGSFDFYGSNRIGDNLFADCVLALDARTGRLAIRKHGASSTRASARKSSASASPSKPSTTGAGLLQVQQSTRLPRLLGQRHLRNGPVGVAPRG